MNKLRSSVHEVSKIIEDPNINKNFTGKVRIIENKSYYKIISYKGKRIYIKDKLSYFTTILTKDACRMYLLCHASANCTW